MRRVIASVIATFCAIGLAIAFAVSPARSGTDDDLCAATDDAVSSEQRIAACTALIGKLKDQPQALAAALINRGATYWYIDKTDLALADLDRAVALDPTNARPFRERANAYRDNGRLDKALADANEAIRLDANEPKSFAGRCAIFDLNGQYDRAIADCSEALRLKPDFALAFKDRGAAYYFKKDYQTAIADYNEAIRLDPKNAKAFTDRTAAYSKLGRFDQAIADDSEAIRIDPLTPEFFDNRGLSYAALSEYDRAIADYNEAIRLKPQANFLTNRGDAYNDKRDYDRAIADYDRAIALNPGFYLAYNNRGAAYGFKGDLDRAIADYEAALRINPQFDQAAENLAAVRVKRDRRNAVNSDNLLPSFDCKKATRAVEKAICSDPDLSRLDREMDAAYKAALANLTGRAAKRLKQEQQDFLATRNRSFGKPQYNFRRELELRPAALRGMSAGGN
jgi:tetratricopeptide (TPR) repeat protein